MPTDTTNLIQPATIVMVADGTPVAIADKVYSSTMSQDVVKAGMKHVGLVFDSPDWETNKGVTVMVEIYTSTDGKTFSLLSQCTATSGTYGQLTLPDGTIQKCAFADYTTLDMSRGDTFRVSIKTSAPITLSYQLTVL